jgi:hypothetical protein
MMKRVAAMLIAAVAVWIVVQSGGGSSSSGARDAPVPTSPSRAPAASREVPPPAPSPVGFRSRDRLVEHYGKHGAEFGRISTEEYLRRAQALRDAPAGGDVLEVTRATDGVVSRFDRATGAFLAFDADGTIRTFFKPNDGEAYFRRQAKRRPAP